MNTCPSALPAAQMAELQAVANSIASGLTPDRHSEWDRDLFTQFYILFLDITECKMHPELLMLTMVIVEHGRNKGRVGSIHGSFETRKNLMEMGLTKTTVRFGDELEMLELKNLRELTAHEQILMGIK